MPNKELIMKVLGDITTRIDSENIRAKNGFKEKKESILVLFTGSSLEDHKALENLRRLMENGFQLTLCFSKNAEEILDIQKIKALLKPHRIYLEEDKNKSIDIIKSFNIAIVPVLTQNTLAKVARGIQDSFISTLLWQLLWYDKKVFINIDSTLNTSCIPCQNKKMLILINNYIDILREFGAKIVKDHSYFTYIRKGLDALEYEEKKALNKRNISFKNVVTEGDILALSETVKELFVDKRTIITPLAKDTAKEKNIRIIL